MIAVGAICAATGAGLLWLDRAARQADAERESWVSGEAQLYEAGIRWAHGEAGTHYELTARYELKIDGRSYRGSRIAAGHSSKSAVAVKALLVPLAPEAADFSLQDLGPLNPERSWSVAYRPVPVRYDPRDPARSELMLERPRGAWIARGIAWALIVAGIALAAFAWRRAHGARPRAS